MTARLTIDIITESPHWRNALPDAPELAQRAAETAWRRSGNDRSNAELSCVLGNDALLQSLNDQYRNKNRPTNVLSFPADDEALPGMPRLLGDVVLAFETIQQEAAAQDKSLAAHFKHLCVHGTLHLLGYDHEDETEAAAMEALEIGILSALGIDNPYATAPMKRSA